MSKQHGARQQKRLAKQKAKRRARRRQVARRNSNDPAVRLKGVDGWPIVASFVPECLWDTGLGSLLITRKTPDGQFASAVFLVDVYCLGVKNALWTIQSQNACRNLYKELDEREHLLQVTPEHFAKLVYCAADYGQSLGFPPHRDFRHAQRLLAGIDPSQCPDEFEFGKDGRPLYIRGPNESIDEARAIIAQVEALGGDSVLPLRSSEAPFELVSRAEIEFTDVEADESSEDDWRIDGPA